jgi:uncharacterized protein HemX
MTTPTFSQFQQNVQRQSREQRAVGSLLSGIAAILLGSIVLVALLAAIGGWVLYGQIRDQSVTVQQLNENFSRDIRDLRTSLVESKNIVEKFAEQTRIQFQAQKQQISSLQTQVDELRTQSRKDRAANQAAIQNLQRRVFELERR